MDNNKGLNISAKSFVLAIIIIFLLMAVTYALTFIIPGGEYARVIDENGFSVLHSVACSLQADDLAFVEQPVEQC